MARDWRKCLLPLALYGTCATPQSGRGEDVDAVARYRNILHYHHPLPEK